MEFSVDHTILKCELTLIFFPKKWLCKEIPDRLFSSSEVPKT